MKSQCLFLWSVLLCSLFFALTIEAGEIERIQAKGEITVSLNKGYPPFSMDQNDQPVGLDVDLARLLADYLGVKVRFIRPETYDEQIPKLLAGESDIIIAAMTRTVERGLHVNFSDPYFEVSQAALVRRDKIAHDANAYFDLAAINNLRLGVKANTTHEAFARQLFPDKAIHTYPTSEAAAEALVKGELDAMTADSPFVRVWRATHPSLHPKVKALLTPVTKEHYGLAIRKGDPEFLIWLNLFIHQIQTDGTMDLLMEDYFVQMNWARQLPPPPHLAPAQMLQNQFLQKKKEMLEKSRAQDNAQRGEAYE